MKLVLVDNFAHETVADILYQENVPETNAKRLADEWNDKNCPSDFSSRFCVVKPDDYVLWRGMADLVGDPEET